MAHKVRFDVITLFPSTFDGPFSESIICRARKKDLIQINLHQLRDYAFDKHKTVDDTPCGGGPGMVLRVDIVDRAISNIKTKNSKLKSLRTVLLTPIGEKFTQQKAIELSKYDNIILICGHYEGFDQRVHQHLVDEEISIGDYVLTGGELPAMVMIDAISRMVPGVIKKESAINESFMPNANKLMSQETKSLAYDYPVYTRPIEHKGWKVPEVLLSGDHKKIIDWRKSKTERK